MDFKQDKTPIAEIGEGRFEAEVLKSKQTVLVAFWAPWSRPCEILRPILEDVAAACAANVKVLRVNADDNPELGMWYEIQSVPTLLYFVDGTVRARVVGTASKEAILARLRTENPGAGFVAPSQRNRGK